MKTTTRPILTALLLLSCAPPDSIAQQPGTSNAPRTIASFELADQYERVHRVEFPTEKVMVIVVANRQGAGELESWIKPLASRFGSQIQISGVADMSAVPALLRPLVRKRFGQERSYPVMMDWQGNIAKQFPFNPHHGNVFVLAREGRLLFQRAGKATARDLDALFAAVEQVMQGRR